MTGRGRIAGLVLGAAAAALLVAPILVRAAAPTDPLAPRGADSPLAIMRVPQALDRLGRPLQDVIVHVPDTGLDLDHPDVQSRLFSLPQATPVPDPDGGPDHVVAAGAPGWDFIGTLAPGPLAPDSDPSDTDGHGTAVAGVLGAAWDNGQGAAGVAPNARFLALRTCWPNDQCYEYVQAAANTWARDRGARVVSMSWLTGAPIDPGFRSSITGAPNTLFVAIPSGNGGATDADPDAANRLPCGLDSPNVLCVTTSSPTDGLDCGDYGATLVDVAVPTQKGVTTTNGGGYAETGCATSYAAPTAAGVATVLFGLDPTATPGDVKSAIIDSARRVPAWAGRSVSGGIVDAEAAVILFSQRRGIPVRDPPAPAPAAPPASPPPAPIPAAARAASPPPAPPIPPRRAAARAPGVSRLLVSPAPGRLLGVRVSVRIAANGAITRWVVQRRTVRRVGPSRRRVVAFVPLRSGTLSASATATVSVTIPSRGRVDVRVLARSRAGTSVSRLVSASPG